MRPARFLALALPLYLAVPLLVGIAGRGMLAKPARYPSVDDATLLAFHHHYDGYFRRRFGCSLTATDPQQCRPALGLEDTDEWRQARELAKRVFQLKD